MKHEPELEEKYFFINSNFEIDTTIWIGGMFDEKRYTDGNYFISRKLAKQCLDGIKKSIREAKKR